LIKVLKTLRDLGNTVIVVEHEEEVMKAADQIIDIGPNAGNLGGELINQLFLTTSGKNGHAKLDFVPVDGHLINNDSHTIRFLTGEETIPLPPARRKAHNFIEVIGARENNLKNVSVRFPLHVLTVVTGVSGSGKSTLIKKVVFPSLKKIFGGFDEETGKVDFVKGALQSVQRVEFVDQNPIGKSSRSNPITYIKAYDVVRDLYADQALSKARGYKPGHFSFNVDGGRCDLCQGEGEVKVEMQFMADIYLKCESCGGKRFKNEVLEVKYKEKDISDVLDMTVDESVVFFKDQNRLVEKLMPLQDVGLGYVKLGQSSNTLSGGEAQRVKLASFIGAGQYGHAKEHIVFIFDEPTTGLHFSDIKKLMDSINRLVDQGNTAIIIEHNMDVIKCADWIIDMGPEGGQKGGYVCFEGTPEEMVKIKDNHTAHYLKEKMRH
jgi:excinuclease ABC subunit A